MSPSVLTFQHSGTNFNEFVAWLVRTLEVLAICYTRGDALWCGAKVQCVVSLRSLVRAVQAEQSSPADASITRVTPRISSTHVSDAR